MRCRWTVLVLLLLVPFASAAETVVTSVEATFGTAWDPADVVAVTSGECTGGNIVATEDSVAFSESDATTLPLFAPGHISTSCAMATLPVAPPLGATRVRVSFETDRQFQESLNTGSYNARQEFGWLTSEGQLEGLQPIFQSDAGPRGVTRFSFDLVLLENASLAWLFDDQGVALQQGTTNPISGQAFSSALRDVYVQYPNVLVAGATTSEPWTRTDVDDLLTVFTHNVSLPIDASYIQPDVDLRIAATNGQKMVRATGPDDADITNHVLALGAGQVLLLNASVLQAHGPGPYVFSYERTEPLVLPDPVPPTRLQWLYPLGLVLTPIAGAFASSTLWRYQKSAQGSFLQTARYLWITLLIGFVYYIFQVLYTWFVVGRPEMETYPLTNQAIAWYIQFTILAIAIVLFGFIVGRRLIHTMRKELGAQAKNSQELARSNAELERFAYVASHDLQEPLRKVASYTQLLQRRYQDQLDEDANDFIGYAVDGAHRMQTLVQGLLQYSRLDRDEQHVQPVNLQEAMNIVEQDLGEAIRERDARLVYADLPTVPGDPLLLRQVLQNLVQNAMKFQPEGQRPIVKVRCHDDGKQWILEVEDNGIGIDEAQHEAVFQVFHRLHHRNEYEGTGLGLAMVRRIAQRHGGDASFTSTPGGGTTFRIFLSHSGT